MLLLARKLAIYFRLRPNLNDEGDNLVFEYAFTSRSDHLITSNTKKFQQRGMVRRSFSVGNTPPILRTMEKPLGNMMPNKRSKPIEHLIQTKLDTYPPQTKKKLLALRTLIIDVIETNDLGDYEETLKWNEPSYLVKGGSTVRIDWKPKTPEQYFIFFNCSTKLVDTFCELYSDVLTFDGNRAIVLNLNEPLPTDALQHCIELSLKYKSIKHLPLLGA